MENGGGRAARTAQQIVGTALQLVFISPYYLPAFTLLVISCIRYRTLVAVLICVTAFLLTQIVTLFGLSTMAAMSLVSARRWIDRAPKTQFMTIPVEEIIPTSAALELFQGFNSVFEGVVSKLRKDTTIVYMRKFSGAGPRELVDQNAYFSAVGSVIFLNNRPSPGIQMFLLLHELGHVSQHAAALVLERVLLLDWLAYLALVAFLARWNWITILPFGLAALAQFCVRYSWHVPTTSRYVLREERVADQFAFDHLRTEDLPELLITFQRLTFPDPRLSSEDNEFRHKRRLKLLQSKIAGTPVERYTADALAFKGKRAIVSLISAVALVLWGQNLTESRLITLVVAEIVLAALGALMLFIARENRAQLIRELQLRNHS